MLPYKQYQSGCKCTNQINYQAATFSNLGNLTDTRIYKFITDGWRNLLTTDSGGIFIYFRMSGAAKDSSNPLFINSYGSVQGIAMGTQLTINSWEMCVNMLNDE